MKIISNKLANFKALTIDGFEFIITDFFMSTSGLEIKYIVVAHTGGLYLRDYYLVPINTITKTDLSNKTLKLSISMPDILSCLPVYKDKIIKNEKIRTHWDSYYRNSSPQSHYIQATFFIRMREIDYHNFFNCGDFVSLQEFKKWHLFFIDGIKRHANAYLIDCAVWEVTDIVIQNNPLRFFQKYILANKHIKRIVNRTQTIYLDQHGNDLQHLPFFNSSRSSFNFQIDSRINYKGEVTQNDKSLIILSKKDFTKTRPESSKSIINKWVPNEIIH